MKAELITVGTEILMGNIVNTNAAFLAAECAGLGISVYYQTTVGDNEKRLAEAILLAKERSDLVILSGGLGPTQDDITKETAAEVMGFPMREDPHTKERIIAFFHRLGRPVIAENNWRQSMVPDGSIVIDNHNGSAPGIIMEKDEVTMILLPGPPDEIVPMWKEQIAPYLEKRMPNVLRSRMVKICGSGESDVEMKILDLIKNQTNPTIAPYAKIGEVHLRVTASAETEEDAYALTDQMVDELYNRFGDLIYTTDESVTLEKAVVELLKKHDYILTTAESCTAGMLGARIVNVAGASDVYHSGYITYSNEAKVRMIQVSAVTLEQFGAVSEQTAKEMAEGAAMEAGADAAISITGIAGPDGGTEEKPVGLVYIGTFVAGRTLVKKYNFSGNRMKVRNYSVSRALSQLRMMLLED